MAGFELAGEVPARLQALGRVGLCDGDGEAPVDGVTLVDGQVPGDVPSLVQGAALDQGSFAEHDERRRLESFFQERTDLRRGQFWEEDPIRVHASLWTSGIVSALSGPALAVLLVLLDYERSPGERVDVPKSRAYEYPLSHSAWVIGTRELQRSGLVEKLLGNLVFAADNKNPRVSADRYRVSWTIRRQARPEESMAAPISGREPSR